MYLHSIRHYFRILKRTARSFGKTALLSSLIIITLGVNVTPLFAQTPLTPAEFATKYNDYIKLFNGSSLTQTGLVKNQQTNKITGFVFNLNLKFPVTPTKNASWHWDHISTSGSDSQSHTFLIRVCNTASSERYCWINTLPFNTGSRAADEANDINNQGINVGSTPEEKNATVYEEASSGEKAVSQGIAISAFQSIGDIYNYQASINEMPAGSLEFVKGNSYIADAWYCANNTNGSSAETAASEYADNGNFKDALVKRFGPTATDSLCGDKSYFRIATSASFTIPADDATINQQVTAGTNSLSNTTDVVADPTTNDGLPECSMTNGAFGAGSFMGCIARLVYYVVYWPVAWFAGLMGSLFDFFLMYSLSDASYRADFAVRGWQLVRDISNIFFIIILVWTGLSAVFGTKNNMKSVVPMLILNALLINFSLFATRVVIDVSNVVARVFYNSMQVTEQNSDGTTKIKEGIGGSKPLSEKIVSSFNPQRMFASGILNQQKATDNVDNTVIKQADSDSQVAGYFIIVSIIAAIIMFGIAMMFWKVAFLFLGRVIGLYIAMIFAPFAFLTQGNMPLVSSIKELSWSKWLDDLTNYALLAPIFVFFLYIIYSFLESDFLKVFHKDVTGSFFETVIFIAIPMLIVYFMVKQGVKIAQDYSGSIGKSVQEWGNKIAGFAGGAALGVATGGTALAGRNILGRLGTRIAESQTLQNASSSGRWYSKIADRTMRVGSGMSAATYDVRNTKLGKGFEKESGVSLDNSLVQLTGTGKNKTEGGFRAAIQRNEKVLNERAQRFQVTGQQARNMDAANAAWESAYQARRNAAQAAALAAGTVFNEAQFRFSDMRAQAAVGNARPRSSAETNRRRERSYQASLGRGTVLSRIAQRATNRITTPIAGGGAIATTAGASVITGGAIVGASAVVGQGAIQGVARQNIIASRRNQARPTVSGGQRNRMLNQLAQLQRDQLRVYTTLSAVVNFLGLPVTPNNINSISVIDVQNYQSANPNHGMASPNTVISERNRINNDINNVRTQLGI